MAEQLNESEGRSNAVMATRSSPSQPPPLSLSPVWLNLVVAAVTFSSVAPSSTYSPSFFVNDSSGSDLPLSFPSSSDRSLVLSLSPIVISFSLAKIMVWLTRNLVIQVNYFQYQHTLVSTMQDSKIINLTSSILVSSARSNRENTETYSSTG